MCIMMYMCVYIVLYVCVALAAIFLGTRHTYNDVCVCAYVCVCVCMCVCVAEELVATLVEQVSDVHSPLSFAPAAQNIEVCLARLLVDTPRVRPQLMLITQATYMHVCTCPCPCSLCLCVSVSVSVSVLCCVCFCVCVVLHRYLC